MTDRIRNAHHEAAHATLGRDHSRRVHRISLRPGLAHAGITQWEPDPPELQVLGSAIDGRHPLDGLMPDAFRFACRRMVETLAGNAAAEIAVPTLGRVPDLPEIVFPKPVEPSTTPADPSPRLLAAEAEPLDLELHDDERIAADMAWRLVGIETPGPLLVWMRAEARRACAERWPVIQSVASALLAAETLDGPAFESLYTPPGAAHEQ